MSGFRGRGRGGWTEGPPKGLFVYGVWQCDCNPRKPAVHLMTKKEGPNKGKWFRTCQEPKEKQCTFFIWDEDASRREKAALLNNTRTEPPRVEPTTPSRRQPSPPPPYTIDTTSSGPSRKRSHAAIDLDEDYGLDQADDDFNNELNSVMTRVETPSKAVKTSEFATPNMRRKLPWQMDQPPGNRLNGLQTPQTGGKTSIDPFNTRRVVPARFTPSRHQDQDAETQQTATPSSSFETPTPSRFRNISAEDLVRDVFDLLQDRNVRLAPDTETELEGLLSRHGKSAEGLRRGRDVIRTTVKAKDAKITELTYRVSTLEAELEAEREMVKHLQWELGAQSDP
ncbi:hypothetical protein CC86DRAFT_378268 [Ophiobolus disseminans]|uniref:GRF-type domain-containing protein n=1 Tax=Ophiobolus disseminans TaxID=1469910 RepID=A0A6A7AFR9_9PLEO|nr:hypothetical protein CC86DRAFT_378268 [Ophiobolus disseminans]